VTADELIQIQTLVTDPIVRTIEAKMGMMKSELREDVNCHLAAGTVRMDRLEAAIKDSGDKSREMIANSQQFAQGVLDETHRVRDALAAGLADHDNKDAKIYSGFDIRLSACEEEVGRCKRLYWKAAVVFGSAGAALSALAWRLWNKFVGKFF
jgi:hypothetical protein